MNNQQIAVLVAAIITAGFAGSRTNLTSRFFWMASRVYKWLESRSRGVSPTDEDDDKGSGLGIGLN